MLYILSMPAKVGKIFGFFSIILVNMDNLHLLCEKIQMVNFNFIY